MDGVPLSGRPGGAIRTQNAAMKELAFELALETEKIHPAKACLKRSFIFVCTVPWVKGKVSCECVLPHKLFCLFTGKNPSTCKRNDDDLRDKARKLTSIIEIVLTTTPLVVLLCYYAGCIPHNVVMSHNPICPLH